MSYVLWIQLKCRYIVGYSYTCIMYCGGYSHTCRMYCRVYSYTCSIIVGDAVIHLLCIVGIHSYM